MSKPIEIKDRFHGPAIITEPVLIELLNSPSLIRLKGVSQIGLPQGSYRYTNFSRETHSRGAMLAIRRLGGSLLDQVRAVTHDVSHSAFSHTIDWVELSGLGGIIKDDAQDRIHHAFIAQSELPEILGKYGYSVAEVANLEASPLLEKEIPDLCVDRLDYSLRQLDPRFAEGIWKHLLVEPEQQGIVFDDQCAAFNFADAFLDLQNKKWGSYDVLARFHIFGEILRRAIDIGVIEKSLLWTTDQQVIAEVTKSDDPAIQNGWQKLICLDRLPRLHRRDQGLNIIPKFRYVDPVIKSQGRRFRLSEADPVFNNRIKDSRAKSANGIWVPKFPLD